MSEAAERPLALLLGTGDQVLTHTAEYYTKIAQLSVKAGESDSMATAVRAVIAHLNGVRTHVNTLVEAMRLCTPAGVFSEFWHEATRSDAVQFLAEEDQMRSEAISVIWDDAVPILDSGDVFFNENPNWRVPFEELGFDVENVKLWLIVLARHVQTPDQVRLVLWAMNYRAVLNANGKELPPRASWAWFELVFKSPHPWEWLLPSIQALQYFIDNNCLNVISEEIK